jgi:hypothetical protein
MKTYIFVLVILGFMLIYVNTLSCEAEEVEKFNKMETGINLDKIPCFNEDLKNRNDYLTIIHIVIIMVMVTIIIYQKKRIYWLEGK